MRKPSRLAGPLLALCLLAAPALAQEAPPHEGEGLSARPRVQQAPAAPHKSAKPAPAKAMPAKGAAPQARKAAPAKPAQQAAARRADDKKPPLRSLDKNHDGRISREEYLSGSKKRFAKADTNHDGVISPQEAKAAKAKLEEQKARREKKRLAQGKPVKPRKKSDRPPKPYLSTFDKNKDGRVTEKEYLARREKKFADMDTNHDGVISREEARQYKQKAAERRAEKKAQAKERRLRKIEAAKDKGPTSVSSTGPELVAPATPPPPPVATPPATPPSQAVPGHPEAPLSPLTPELPAQNEPET